MKLAFPSAVSGHRDVRPEIRLISSKAFFILQMVIACVHFLICVTGRHATEVRLSYAI
jgi:hypothetical protein